MRIVDPHTGREYVEKRRRRYNEASEPRELTFSCYRGYAFLLRERTREWFRESLETARRKFGFQLWAYVVMPEHVHLLVVPPVPPSVASQDQHSAEDAPARPSKTQGVPPVVASKDPRRDNDDEKMSRFLQAVKEPVGRKAIAYLRASAPSWLPRLHVQEGQRIRHRFWQPGGGYDRNVTQTATLRSMIDYLHADPVRRGLVAKAEDWEWSSARWFAGLKPVKIEMDREVLAELQWD